MPYGSFQNTEHKKKKKEKGIEELCQSVSQHVDGWCTHVALQTPAGLVPRHSGFQGSMTGLPITAFPSCAWELPLKARRQADRQTAQRPPFFLYFTNWTPFVELRISTNSRSSSSPLSALYLSLRACCFYLVPKQGLEACCASSFQIALFFFRRRWGRISQFVGLARFFVLGYLDLWFFFFYFGLRFWVEWTSFEVAAVLLVVRRSFSRRWCWLFVGECCGFGLDILGGVVVVWVL